MNCITCGSTMEYIKTYGDGYYEPHEDIYQCPFCHNIYSESEDGYCDWEDIPYPTVQQIREYVGEIQEKGETDIGEWYDMDGTFDLIRNEYKKTNSKELGLEDNIVYILEE